MLRTEWEKILHMYLNWLNFSQGKIYGHFITYYGWMNNDHAPTPGCLCPNPGILRIRNLKLQGDFANGFKVTSELTLT